MADSLQISHTETSGGGNSAPSGKALCLDLGKARIGVAITDSSRMLALPYRTIRVSSWATALADDTAALEEIAEIVEADEVTDIVIGLPLKLDGSEGDNAREIGEFGEALAEELNNPEAAESNSATSAVSIHYSDERFSTVQAHAQLHELGKQPSRERAIVDQLAAVNILQGWLDGRSVAATALAD